MTDQEAKEIKLSVEESSVTKRVLKVEVPAEELDPEFYRTYKAFQKKAKWPGFRPGKVPIQMIRKRMGREVTEELLQRMLPVYYSRALEKEALDPVDMPIIRNVHLKEGEPLRFDATVYIKPPFEVRDYKGIPLRKKEPNVPEEFVDRVLQDMRERSADLSSYEDDAHALEQWDVAEVDFEGFVDGEPLEGGKAENHLIEVGGGKMLPDLEKGFLGMKKGERKEVEAIYPEDFHANELAGKKILFKVHLKDIKKKHLPELDDEFAKDVGEKLETLEELKDKIRESLRGREEKRIREERHLDLMDKVLERNPIEELPEVMVDRQKRSLKESMEPRLQHSGMTPAEMGKMLADDKLEEKARRDVAWSLILDQIVDKEGITVETEELEKELEKAAWEASMSKDVLKELYMKERGSLEPFRLSLLNEKVLDFLLENAKVTEESSSEAEGGSDA